MRNVRLNWNVHMLNSLLLLAKNEPIAIRIAGCLLGCLVGIIFIYIGRQNVRTQRAEESGKRRGVNALLGASNSYSGSKAVFVGWVRILCGVMAIVFGFVFLVFGAFLAP